MRFAVIGPSQTSTAPSKVGPRPPRPANAAEIVALCQASFTVLRHFQVDRALYLGTDGAMKQVADVLAETLGLPADIVAHARDLVPDGDPDALFEAATHIRMLQELARVHALETSGQRTLEMISGRLTLLCDDKQHLDEEDLLPVSMIVFGAGERMIRRVGSRTFLCPGSPSVKGSGILILEEQGDRVLAAFAGADGEVTSEEFIDSTGQGAKLKVSG